MNTFNIIVITYILAKAQVDLGSNQGSACAQSIHAETCWIIYLYGKHESNIYLYSNTDNNAMNIQLVGNVQIEQDN